MGDFLRLSIKTVVLEIRILYCFLENKNCTAVLCIFSLRIVKSLQLRGRRQIAELRKYCLVRVIVFFFFFWRLFSLFYFLFFWFLTGWEFGLILYKLYKYTLGIIVPTFWDCIIKPKAQNNQQHFS